MLIPEGWRLVLSSVRVAIALAAVALELYPVWYPSSILAVVFIIYFVYSILAIYWQSRDQGASDLLRLVLDLIAMLLCTMSPPDRGGWLTACFYTFVLAQASLLHQLREVTIVVTAMGIASLLTRAQDPSLWRVVVLPGLLALGMAWQKRSISERLQHAARQNVMFRSEAENARELERQRIAADFHDGPLQSFISFQMRLEVIKKLLARDQGAAINDLVQLQDICRKQITDMRAFVRSMRMSADGSGPATSVRQIADDFQKTSGITLSWNVGDALSGLEPEISHEVLQIIREALHNAQKHSRASRVSMKAEKDESALSIRVEDDGAGFPFAGRYSLEELELMRMGPESIKRRVRTLGGELTIESQPGRGATLAIRVPI